MKIICEAKEELEKGIRPELKQYSDNLNDYDTIFLGFPNMEQGFNSVLCT